MYTAILKTKGDNVIVTLESNDSDVILVYPMTVANAKLLRLWLNGMVGNNGPLEVKIGNIDHFLPYEVWNPLRDIINNWYEENYA